MARAKTTKRTSRQTKSRSGRRILHYPLLAFLMLCAGVFLMAATLKANGQDIFVTARIPAPFVTSPAVINSPVDGERFSSIPIPVRGTCPSNAAYVNIFRNNLMSGTAICSGGLFQLSIDLFPGQNDLVAHVYNSTDDEGPVSDTVSVFYDVPKPPVLAPGTPIPSSPPFTLKTAFVYKGYIVGQTIKWPIEISGGYAPYAVSIDWGDGTSDVISRTQDGQFDISHKYSSSGGYKGSYIIKIQASDSAGQKAYIQFFVIVNSTAEITPAASIYNKPPPSLTSDKWLWLAWPAYVLLLLLVVSYWLGEREELIVLRNKGLLKR